MDRLAQDEAFDEVDLSKFSMPSIRRRSPQQVDSFLNKSSDHSEAHVKARNKPRLPERLKRSSDPCFKARLLNLLRNFDAQHDT